jgi:aspartate carbamoyltransferase catalytic subunit
MFTMRRKLGTLAGIKVAIVGDLTHSRVARSNIWGLTKMGAEVRVCGPSTLTPREIERMGVTWTWRVEEALEDVDVVNILRVQKERQSANLLPSMREYALYFGVTRERLRAAKPDVMIMHPGPMNRGVEIAQDVAEDPRNVILDQVTNGVAVRMAVLYLLNGNEPASREAAMDMVEA